MASHNTSQLTEFKSSKEFFGAVPIRFKGLASNTGVRLYQVINGKRVPFDQSVHGNDYWQTDYNPATILYEMTLNLLLDELKESTWILTGDKA